VSGGRAAFPRQAVGLTAPVFADRRRRDDRLLEWKVRLFSIAAVLVVAGLFLDEKWITGTAIGVLVIAMLLRLVPGGKVAEGEEDGV